MNCFDCQTDVIAVAVCGRCGAGVCREHVVEQDEHLTVLMPINRPVAVEPPARRLRCQRCHAAETAQAQAPGRRQSRRQARATQAIRNTDG